MHSMCTITEECFCRNIQIVNLPVSSNHTVMSFYRVQVSFWCFKGLHWNIKDFSCRWNSLSCALYTKGSHNCVRNIFSSLNAESVKCKRNSFAEIWFLLMIIGDLDFLLTLINNKKKKKKEKGKPFLPDFSFNSGIKLLYDCALPI